MELSIDQEKFPFLHLKFRICVISHWSKTLHTSGIFMKREKATPRRPFSKFPNRLSICSKHNLHVLEKLFNNNNYKKKKPYSLKFHLDPEKQLDMGFNFTI